MRRTPLALSSLALAATLTLAGCSGSSGSSSASAPASASAAATAASTVAQNVQCSDLTIDSDSDALPTVSGDAGKEPTLKWSGKSAPSNLTVKTLEKGSGAEVSESDFVKAGYAGWQWGSDTVFDSSFQRGSDTTFSLVSVISGWRCGLAGHHVGDRVEMSIPASLAYGDSASSSGAPTGPLVFVVEITGSHSAKDLAAGTKDAQMVGEDELSKRGITVTGDLGAAATIKVNDGATEPTKTEVIVLAKGTGPAVTEKDSLLINMAYTDWKNSGTQSSWDADQAQPIDMSTATGLKDLVGVPVGSRVVVLLPGSTSTADASGTSSSAYAYVMDIEATM
ncbi:FKBP-type peptidyl-prolyl cis-trans isomerase [Actinomyces haliotis]|uniref:FKBP-type peptidyl-prolyl cis-trans isomerase n=1 Tax=Actinomyces haliotis TaxID=1280843 RepID=UPI0018900725|nr:FKBP-type peptidyl-prolyl cis-trans isomerase [Actinomyces haliotis]